MTTNEKKTNRKRIPENKQTKIFQNRPEILNRGPDKRTFFCNNGHRTPGPYRTGNNNRPEKRGYSRDKTKRFRL